MNSDLRKISRNKEAKKKSSREKIFITKKCSTGVRRNRLNKFYFEFYADVVRFTIRFHRLLYEHRLERLRTQQAKQLTRFAGFKHGPSHNRNST